MLNFNSVKIRVLLLAVIFTLGSAPTAWSGVLVFGGTGQLGARVVKLLADAGEEVTVFARLTSDRSRLDGVEVNFIVGDLLNDTDVASAFEPGAYRAVIIAVRAPLSEAGFYEVISDHIVSQAKESGVGQIIFHGAVGAGDNMALHADVPWKSIPGLYERMMDQGIAEAILLNSGISATIIRNSRVWPDETPSSGYAELTEDQSSLTPITREDLARFTMDCLDNAVCTGKIYHARDTTLSLPPPPPGVQAD